MRFLRYLPFVALLQVGTARADTLAAGAPTTNFSFGNHVTGVAQVTDFRFLPDGRMVIVRKSGEVHVRTAAGTLVDAGTFTVDSTSEKGLLGVEVDPAFATTNRLFFYYSRGATATDPGTDLDRHRVVSVTLGSDNKLVMSTEFVIARGLRGPANHDGGGLAIGPDGKLYIGVGDTGCNSGVAPGGTITNYFGTCLTNGNGKILRRNLDGSVPTDNPLVALTAVTACGNSCGTNVSTTGTGMPRTDIWAWGFRNPFRFSFDSVTGNLWVGDVGEVTYEEISIVPKGKHMGWPWREGANGYPATKCTEITPNVGNCVDPVYQCRHGAAAGGVDGDCDSISGGTFVDHCSWPAPFRGLYYFGDNANNALWTIQPNAARDGIVAGSRKDFGTVTGSPVSMRVGPDGALYIASLGGGRIARFAPKTPVVCGDAGVDTGPADTAVVDAAADTAVTDSAATTDTGTTDDTNTSSADSSTTSDATLDDTGLAVDGGTDDSGGCGCTTPRATTTTPLLLLGALAAVIGKRRRGARC